MERSVEDQAIEMVAYKEKLKALMDDLSPRQLSVFALTMEGFTLDDIAGEFGVTKQAISQRMAAVKEVVAKYFGGDY
ncbi:MAG TPA: sigma factor-like helix-turn-helix DNA-binding protein [Thermodesulfobacteriota bacterium]|nr:sigma factor-like helix-turn-helix DNA-binding protein [Thermodesulfobacteriota bacterium]